MATINFPAALKPLSENFKIESCDRSTCVLSVGKEKISLPMDKAYAAAAAFQQMSGLKNSAARFGGSAASFTLKTAENIGNGLVKLGKIDERLASLAFEQIVHTGIAYLVAQAKEGK